jgi:Na+-transporting NADH:ubiquinone oxidoreductase subunit C
MFSNRYIFIYASVMVIIVAAVLSAAAMFLQPFQERNVRIERIQNILASAGINSTRDNAEQLFEKHIVTELLIDRHGNIMTDDRRAFYVDLRDELRKLTELNAGRSTEEPAFPMFVCEVNDELSFIVPVFGGGLWGALWGFIALEADFNTVVGVVFDHAGETPGLGSAVAYPSFHEQFIGKKIFDENDNFVSISVVKGGIANSRIASIHGVDAISGGTITSDGSAEMIRVSLGNYVNFFKARHAEARIHAEQQEIIEEEILAVVEEPRPAPRPRPVVQEEPQVVEEPAEEETTPATTEITTIEE